MPDHNEQRHGFSPIDSEEQWTAQGWSDEPESLTAEPRLASTVSIQLDPEQTRMVRRAADRLGITRSEFVRRATLRGAETVLAESPQPSVLVK